MSSSTEGKGVQELKLLSLEEMHARKPGIIPKMWTTEEDNQLREAIKIYGDKNWKEVAKCIPGRSYIQCLQRWKKALRPGLVKGHWTSEEDSNLLKLVEYYAPNWDWNYISKQIEGRNAKQCRERWFLNLDPSINRGPWTREEDEELLKYVAQWGSRWALIAKQLPGRTENSVKTRFHSLKRKEARNRVWSQKEDEEIIAGVLKFGREFGLIQKSLSGSSRTKGQIKRRFAILQQQRPELMRQVYAVEDRIRQAEQQEQENRAVFERVFDGTSERSLRKRDSTPLDQIQNTFVKTDSQILLSNLLENDDKMDTTEKTMTRQDSLAIPFMEDNNNSNDSQRRPTSFRRYNTSVEMLSGLLNESVSSINGFSEVPAEFPAPGTSNTTKTDPAILKRADSLFREAFGNDDPTLRKVDSFLAQLDINNNEQKGLKSYPSAEKTHTLLKRASSGISGFFRVDSSDMKSLLNLL